MSAASATRTLTVVVPAYNEEANLAAAVAEIHAACRGRVADYEIVVVDDGSRDGTGALADALAAADPRVRALHNRPNRGLGGAYKAGVAAARHAHVMMVPGDNSHPAEGVTPIIDRIGEADIVIPYVTNPESRGFARRVVSRAYTLLHNALFRLRVPYYNGLVVHRTALLRSITIETDGFAYQSEALVKLLRGGASFVSVGVVIDEGPQHRSTAFRPKNVMRVGVAVLRLAADVYGPRGARTRRPA